ncbi:PREDICTED: putative F-box protein At3g52320 [Ipomoea nil]|uniref:putative F-box protein At3g52320 n=1 Tax=Ipomoea nil TaxID=35883 RepID=UPI000900F5A3|nr:PREDICTED: putative F-box protein At3g52320 [Ipomoea nil]
MAQMSKAMPTVSDASPSVPEDMVAEILSRLPVESLLRFKCVCKEWYQLIQQDDFIEKHHRHGAMSFYYHKEYINQPFYWPDWRIPPIHKDAEFTCIDIQKGLVLEQERREVPTERLRIRNPATRQTVYLPDLRVGNEQRTWVVARMFFVAKSSKECKVISFSDLEESVLFGRFRVLTVGVDAAWRPLKNSPPNSIHCISKAGGLGRHPKIYALSIENIFYVVAMDGKDRNILWVNSEDESIKTAEIPENLFSDWKFVMPREWNSKLSLFYNGGIRDLDQINICVFVNNNKNEWTKTQTVDLKSFIRDYPIPFFTEEKKIWVRGINGKRWEVIWIPDVSLYGVVPWRMKDELSIKPTVLQLKGMESDKFDEAIGARFWKERDMPTTTSQIISAISIQIKSLM